MLPASLKELPAPPAGKIGWPWNEESPALHALASGGRQWPKISIVTPSYNQGKFIEATIRSVLLQRYPNLEYIIYDGGSSDNTVEIIKRYEPWLSYWASEKDRGQSHAINKGLEKMTGDIFYWLNSDDRLLPGALEAVANAFLEEPDAIVWVGTCSVVDEVGKSIRVVPARGLTRDEIGDWKNNSLYQPACFARMDSVRKVGYVDEFLHYAMDFDFWMRLAELGRFECLDKTLAEATIHPMAKTQSFIHLTYAEMAIVQCRYKYENLARELIGERVLHELFLEKKIERVTSSRIFSIFYPIIRPLLKLLKLVGQN